VSEPNDNTKMITWSWLLLLTIIKS
jgi:hypothetical protein